MNANKASSIVLAKALVSAVVTLLNDTEIGASVIQLVTIYMVNYTPITLW